MVLMVKRARLASARRIFMRTAAMLAGMAVLFGLGAAPDAAAVSALFAVPEDKFRARKPEERCGKCEGKLNR